MFRHSKCYLVLVLLFVAFLENAGLAQSLTVRQSGQNQISLEASAPPTVGFRVQGSPDLETWEDISDQAAVSFAHQIDLTNNLHRFFRLRTWETADLPITLAILGDSTVADFVNNSEEFYGWGAGMYEYMKPNVRVVNLATPVQSSKSFLTSIQRDNLVIIKPEFVLVQFGLVDTADSELLKTSIPEYEANLITIVQIIRDFGGTPILVTPSNTRYFDSAGKVLPYLADRSASVRKVSSELQTYLIDLNQLSIDLYNELGPAASDYITWNGPQVDRTHFSLLGAEVIAGLVADALPEILKSQVVVHQ